MNCIYFFSVFVAEGGQECFQESQEELQKCFNQTFDAQTQSDLKNITIDSEFKLEFKVSHIFSDVLSDAFHQTTRFVI